MIRSLRHKTPSFFSRVGILAACALALAGCASSVKLDESKVPVEDRSAQAPAGGAAAGGTAQSGVSTVNLDNRASAAAGLARTVYFDFDSFAVREDGRPVIDAHARRLNGTASLRMVVEGHTDERGSREYNLALGQRRAESVVRALTLLGAKSEQLEAVSFGMERPAVQGSNEAAWAQNRRAELKDR